MTAELVVEARARTPSRRRMFGRDPRELAAIFVGGSIGSGARTLLSSLIPTTAGHWPWPTFAVNIVGAALLGYFTTRLTDRLPFTRYRRPLLGTGVCGGLTTFSTMQVEALGMIDGHDYVLAAGYLLASIAAGLLAVHLSTQLTRRVRLVRL